MCVEAVRRTEIKMVNGWKVFLKFKNSKTLSSLYRHFIFPYGKKIHTSYGNLDRNMNAGFHAFRTRKAARDYKRDYSSFVEGKVCIRKVRLYNVHWKGENTFIAKNLQILD